MLKKKLLLTESEKDYLSRIGWVAITRDNYSIVIIRTYKNADANYEIHIANPYDNSSIDKQMYSWENKKKGIKK